MKKKVFVSIGSNRGNSFEIINNCITLIENSKKFDDVIVSPFYLTEPVGNLIQNNFLNAVLSFTTSLTPYALLTILQHYEAIFGRTRFVKWGPRTLDLDIIFYDNLIIKSPHLKLPHPEFPYRGFVLKPLSDIDPDFIDPVSGVTISDLYAKWRKNYNDSILPYYPKFRDYFKTETI